MFSTPESIISVNLRSDRNRRNLTRTGFDTDINNSAINKLTVRRTDHKISYYHNGMSGEKI